MIFIGFEMLLRNIPNDYLYKRDFLNKNAPIIDKLFLGSSHAYYGINPEYISGNSFNASHISQSIDLDYKLLEKYEDDLEKLKYVIIPIDYFSLFTKLSESEEFWRIKNYNIYYKLNLSKNIADYFELLSINISLNLQRINSYYVMNQSSITCTDLGYGNDFRKNVNLEKSGIEAAQRHTAANFSLLKENIEVLEKILDLASNNDIEVIFYTSPAYNTYYSNLNEHQLSLTTSKLDSIAKINDNCTYFNFLESEHFSSTDFRDADHLNETGAKTLSKLLEKLINSK